MNLQAVEWAGRQHVGGAGPKLMLLALAHWADEFGECWPSQERLAEFCNLSVRSVRNHLQMLLSRGLIERSTRGFSQRSGEIFSTFFRLKIPKNDHYADRQNLPPGLTGEKSAGRNPDRPDLQMGRDFWKKSTINQSINFEPENSAVHAPRAGARGLNLTLKLNLLNQGRFGSSLGLATRCDKNSNLKKTDRSEALNNQFVGVDDDELIDDRPEPAEPEPDPEPEPDAEPAKPRKFSAAEMQQVFERCLEVAGPGLGDPAKCAGLHLTKPRILSWLNAGYDLELDILPVIAARTAKPQRPPITTWSYFDAAIAEQAAKNRAPMPRAKSSSVHKISEKSYDYDRVNDKFLDTSSRDTFNRNEHGGDVLNRAADRVLAYLRGVGDADCSTFAR